MTWATFLGEELKGSYQRQRCWAMSFQRCVLSISNLSFSPFNWGSYGTGLQAALDHSSLDLPVPIVFAPSLGPASGSYQMVWGFSLPFRVLLDFGVSIWPFIAMFHSWTNMSDIKSPCSHLKDQNVSWQCSLICIYDH